jgi:predicted small lipoprotein YifL
MRLNPSFLAILTILASLNGCGTKTPLKLPPPATAKTAVPPAPTPAVDHNNKAATESRQ